MGNKPSKAHHSHASPSPSSSTTKVGSGPGFGSESGSKRWATKGTRLSMVTGGNGKDSGNVLGGALGGAGGTASAPGHMSENGRAAPALAVVPSVSSTSASYASASSHSSVPVHHNAGSPNANKNILSADLLGASKLQPHQQPQEHQLPPPIPPRHPPQMSPPATVPCQYRTGKTLGSGTYAIVKEAVHIKTGKYFACKVINKKLMEGREYMVRNEIAVLKRVSKGHRNIVTLHDYFETTHNLYLCFDLCTGGELFDRICAKGNYFESDAAGLVRTLFKTVEYIHGCGIVHRDLKPENLLFRTKAEDADIMIADFGLSRIMDEDKLQLLTEICGTPGYMAPEIFKKSGHGKPVDVWAMGVITYFLLCGYTPFDRDTQEQEMQAIIRGDYAFEPQEYWSNVSETAKDFVRTCLTVDPNSRPTAHEALEHRWLHEGAVHFVADPESPTGGPKDLLPTFRKGFDARKTFRSAVLGMMAMKRMTMLTATHVSPHARELASNIRVYQADAEKEIIDANLAVVHHPSDDDGLDTSAPPTPVTPHPLSITTNASAQSGTGAESHSSLSPPVAQFGRTSLGE